MATAAIEKKIIRARLNSLAKSIALLSESIITEANIKLGPVTCKLHAEYSIVAQVHKAKSRGLRIKKPVTLGGMVR